MVSGNGMTVKVKNITTHSVKTPYVETTVSIGLAHGSRNQQDNRVYVLRRIKHNVPTTHDELKACVASTMVAMRNQWQTIIADYPHDHKKAWEEYLNMATQLTWSGATQNVLYVLNSLNGLPSLVGYTTSARCVPATFLQSYQYANDVFRHIKDQSESIDEMLPPYHAFAQYGTTITDATLLLSTFQAGIGAPLVANEHMYNETDEKQLQWANVAMHMYASDGLTSTASRDNDLALSLNRDFTKNVAQRRVYNDIAKALTLPAPGSPIVGVATQAIAPYPVQWRSNDVALAQAMEIAAQKLVGTDNFKKHLGLPGDAMNVAMGAAYFCMKPSANQIHLKTMYTQEDRVMPNDSQAFVRDMTGARTKYLEALQGLIAMTS